MNRRLAFFSAVAAQLALLGLMVAREERVLLRGERVVLAIEAVDPIDYLRGRYVSFRPRIATIDLASVALDVPKSSIAAGSKIAVELVPEGNHFVARRLVDEPLLADARPPFLRAVVTSVDGATLTLDYGLDRYFIPANAADPSPLTRDPRHDVSISVRVLGDGRCVIEELLIDGEPFADWNEEQKPR